MGAASSSASNTLVQKATAIAHKCRNTRHINLRSPKSNAVPGRGILKRASVIKKLKQDQQGAFSKALRFLGIRRRVVSFQDTVRATSFARTLGNGTVPGDGTLVTLGLGKPLRQVLQPLAGLRKPGDRRIEESAWLPSQERVRLLRSSMGDAKFFAAWRLHRQETYRVRAMREESAHNGQDHFFMPTSWEEARARALQFSQEAFQFSQEAAAPVSKVSHPKIEARERATRRKNNFVKRKLLKKKRVQCTSHCLL